MSVMEVLTHISVIISIITLATKDKKITALLAKGRLLNIKPDEATAFAVFSFVIYYSMTEWKCQVQ